MHSCLVSLPFAIPIRTLGELLIKHVNCSHSNAVATAWFTPLRTFGDSCTWLAVERLVDGLK